jgi:hypothetical protein
MGSMLTVVIVHFKPSIKHEKGHISTSNIELGFQLIEFHRFWWIYVSTGVFQEKEARYEGPQAKNHIQPRTQVKKDLEDMRRQPTKGGPPRRDLGQPTPPQVSWPRGPPVSHGLLYRFLHCLRVCIFAVDWSRFDPRALIYPTGLYKQALTPGREAIKPRSQKIRRISSPLEN